ncbi:MAG: response regulator transcription factor [Planctomycetota bacterium]|nr:response regulator transcription factor [Planctomycetota bacterium]MDG1983502.1 response regulator transcription factor [Planctomycetota bacterium]
MRILVVEDYGPLRGPVVTALREEGWTVDVAGDGEGALRVIEEQALDLVILDLMIPGIDGLNVLQRTRADGNLVHVLVVTARDSVEDRVRALDAGADDYLVKPFAIEELIARTRALLRRKFQVKSPVLQVGPLFVSTTERLVKMNDQAIDLTAREYALLEYFAYRPNEVVTRAEAHLSLYGGNSSASSNVVDVYVGYLRKKLEAGGAPRVLHTRRGQGYILTAPNQP